MIISLHLPKTAGSSFARSLEAHFGPRLLKDYADVPINTPVYERNQAALRASIDIGEQGVTGMACIHGHFLPLKYLLLGTKQELTFITWMRNPVERAYSQYLMHLTKKQLTTSFHEQLLKELNQSFDHRGPHIQLECGLYSEDVKRFLNTFEKNNVKIIIFEEFIKNIEDTVEEILKFLDQYSKITNFNNKVHNKFSPARGTISERILTSKSLFKISKRIMSKSTRKSLIDKFLIGEQVKPKMDAEDRDALIKYYKSDVIKLKKILGRKLPWPDFQ